MYKKGNIIDNTKLKYSCFSDLPDCVKTNLALPLEDLWEIWPSLSIIPVKASFVLLSILILARSSLESLLIPFVDLAAKNNIYESIKLNR